MKQFQQSNSHAAGDLSLRMDLFSRTRLVAVLALALAFLLLAPTARAAESGVDAGLQAPSVNINPNPAFAEGLPEQMQCLVCHGDPELEEDKVLKSLYYSREDARNSVHLTIGCAGCHTNYTTPPASEHEKISLNQNKDFSEIAKASCVNCHDHQKTIETLLKSAPGGEPTMEAETDQPFCLDCHHFHEMTDQKKDKEFAVERHMSSFDICGKCHKKAWASYKDYYHGRAYKAGDVRAPACWDCHGNHNNKFSGDESSLTSKKNLIKTCGKCHDDIDETFVSYAPLVHDHTMMFQTNPLVKWLVNVIKRLSPKPALKVES
jgi:hypothetical protein